MTHMIRIGDCEKIDMLFEASNPLPRGGLGGRWGGGAHIFKMGIMCRSMLKRRGLTELIKLKMGMPLRADRTVVVPLVLIELGKMDAFRKSGRITTEKF